MKIREVGKEKGGNYKSNNSWIPHDKARRTTKISLDDEDEEHVNVDADAHRDT